MANIIIRDVALTPNPVRTGETVLLSVEIVDIVYAILDSNGNYIMASNGKVIEKTPKTNTG